MAIVSKESPINGKCLQCGSPPGVWWRGREGETVELCAKCVITVCGGLIADAITAYPAGRVAVIDRLMARVWRCVAEDMIRQQRNAPIPGRFRPRGGRRMQN